MKCCLIKTGMTSTLVNSVDPDEMLYNVAFD